MSDSQFGSLPRKKSQSQSNERSIHDVIQNLRMPTKNYDTMTTGTSIDEPIKFRPTASPRNSANYDNVDESESESGYNEETDFRNYELNYRRKRSISPSGTNTISSDRSNFSNSSHRKSVSFDLKKDDYKSVYSMDETKLQKSKYSIEDRLRNESYFQQQDLPPHKGILRSPSPNSYSTIERTTNRYEKSTENIYEEIERENPFRNEILTTTPTTPTTKHPFLEKKFRNSADHLNSYSAIKKSFDDLSRSNENLFSDGVRKIPIKISNKSKPILPPKPLKHADLLKNEGLYVLKSEMDKGNFIEYEHDFNTNVVKKIIFNPDRPLPPIPSNNNQIEIVPAKFSIVPTQQFIHENSNDNILVTEEEHSAMLLHENELRNAFQNDEDELYFPHNINSSNQFIYNQNDDEDDDEIHQMNFHETNPFSPTFGMSTNKPPDFNLPPPPLPQGPPPPLQTQSHFIPQSQILPVHYSQLPMLQQPSYYQMIPQQQQQQQQQTHPIQFMHPGQMSVSYVPMANYMMNEQMIQNQYFTNTNSQIDNNKNNN